MRYLIVAFMFMCGTISVAGSFREDITKGTRWIDFGWLVLGFLNYLIASMVLTGVI